MSGDFAFLWDRSGPLGHARVVLHTASRLVVRATSVASRADVLTFKGGVATLSDVPLHRLWESLQSSGLEMANLENRAAWNISRLASACNLAVTRVVSDVGTITFFDHLGRTVVVPNEKAQALLTAMRLAGCVVQEVAVD
jgi:hypothetical protein